MSNKNGNNNNIADENSSDEDEINYNKLKGKTESNFKSSSKKNSRHWP